MIPALHMRISRRDSRARNLSAAWFTESSEARSHCRKVTGVFVPDWRIDWMRVSAL